MLGNVDIVLTSFLIISQVSYQYVAYQKRVVQLSLNSDMLHIDSLR